MPAPTWKQYLYVITRSSRFLWLSAIAILATGVLVGYVATRLHPPRPAKIAERILARAGLPVIGDDEQLDRLPSPIAEPGQRLLPTVPAFEEELADRAVTFAQLFPGLPELAAFVLPEEVGALRELLVRRFGPTDGAIAVDYVTAYNGTDAAAEARLRQAANASVNDYYANFAVARIEMKRGNFAAAAQSYRRAGSAPAAAGARYRALVALLKARDYAALEALRRDPAYARLFDRYVVLKLAAAERDWKAILWQSPRLQFSGYDRTAVGMSAVVGLAWVFFLAHLGEWPGIASRRALLALAALGCGVLSTVPTLYAVIWQEDILKVTLGTEPAQIILYYVAGVGLREEACKLLLFAPLLLVLWWRDDELEVLLAASFVGLGFALEENAAYFVNSEGTSAAGRFITANFFHLALTGVNGLALFRALRWGARGVNEFLWVFPLTIAAHGVYDALPEVRAVPFGNYIAIMVFVGVCYLYFERAHALRTTFRTTVSVTAAFVLGAMTVVATLLAYEMANLGPGAALATVLSELLGSAILVIAFIRIFNEPLSA